MIEAVNSVVSNAPLVRGQASQTDVSRSVDVAVQAVSAVSSDVQSSPEPILAPYVSPYIEVDNNYNKAVLQIRDSNTGDVIRQFPSESRLAQRAAEASVDAVQERNASQQVAQAERVAPEAREGASVKSSVPGSAPVEASSSPAQAQIAAAAFAATAQASTATSGSVSVFA